MRQKKQSICCKDSWTRKIATLKFLKHDKVESYVVMYRGLVALVVTLR